MPSWIFKEEGVQQRETKKGDSKKKPAQAKKSDKSGRQDVKVQEGGIGEKYDES